MNLTKIIGTSLVALSAMGTTDVKAQSSTYTRHTPKVSSPKITYIGDLHNRKNQELASRLEQIGDRNTAILYEQPVGHNLDGLDMRGELSYEEIRTIRKYEVFNELLAGRKGIIRTFDITGEQREEYIESSAEYTVAQELLKRFERSRRVFPSTIERDILDQYGLQTTEEDAEALVYTTRSNFQEAQIRRQEEMCEAIVDISEDYPNTVAVVGNYHITARPEGRWKPCHAFADSQDISYEVFLEEPVETPRLTDIILPVQQIWVKEWASSEGYSQREIRDFMQVYQENY